MNTKHALKRSLILAAAVLAAASLSRAEETAAPAANDGKVLLDRKGGEWVFTSEFPTNDPPAVGGHAWSEPGYAPAGWKKVTLPAGYDTKTTLQEVSPLPNTGGDYFFLGTFVAPDPLPAGEAWLRVNSDNGAIVYLNGKLVDNDPAAHAKPGHNPKYWNRDVAVPAGALKPGQNSLAVHVANNEGSSDAFLALELRVKPAAP